MRSRPLVVLLFFLSGAAGLVYQVVWTRQLSLIFGVTVFAASSVLASFMGGLALGSWWVGRWIDRSPNPLRVYAWLEAGIGLAALAVPVVLGAIEPLYVAAARALEDQFLLFNLFRAVLVGLVLLVPTTLMGGTVPAIGRYLVARPGHVGFDVGLLYGINTGGAVLGCIAAGFFFVPNWGVAATTWTWVAVNLAIAGAILLFRIGADDSPVPDPPRTETVRQPRDLEALVALVVFGVSGFAALGYELLWTRVLVVYVHNTSYAFSVMLAVFLGGLALGDALMLRFYDRVKRPLVWLGSVQLGTALSVVAAAAAYQALPKLHLGTLGIEGVREWGDALLLMGVRAGLVLLPSTILLGTMFPLVARAVCGDLRDVGRHLGSAYAANTAGAILGALGTAFVLIPALGLRGTLVALGVLNCLLAALCFLTVRGWSPRPALVPAALACAALPFLAVPSSLFYDALTGGGWKLAYYHEGVTDTTGVWERESDGERVVTYGDQRGTAGTYSDRYNRRQAHIAHLLHPDPVRSLQIGFGVGNTLAAAALYPGLTDLDVVELSPQVRETAPYFWTNDDVLSNPKVRLVIDDGRNFLLRADTEYDVITLEPPEIFTADVVNLYTVEFYELAAKALAEDGILVQWIPTYTVGEEETKMLVRAMLEVFPDTSLWRHGPWDERWGGPMHQLLVVSSPRPWRVDAEALARRMQHPALRTDLEETGTPTPGSLLSLYITGSQGLRRWIGDAPAVTDDHTIVDFSTPRASYSGFGLGPLRFLEGYTELLVPISEHKRDAERLYRSLVEPVGPRFVPGPGAEEATAEALAYQRGFDEGAQRWQRMANRRSREARAEGP